MNCCDTSNESANYQLTFPDIINDGMRRRLVTIMGYLIEMVTPESTDPPSTTAGQNENRILGAVKALVWVAISIGIGIALANVLS